MSCTVTDMWSAINRHYFTGDICMTMSVTRLRQLLMVFLYSEESEGSILIFQLYLDIARAAACPENTCFSLDGVPGKNHI